MDPEEVTYYSDGDIAGILLWPHGVFSVLATSFVGLRLYTARFVSTRSKSGWTVDEIICVVALVRLPLSRFPFVPLMRAVVWTVGLTRSTTKIANHCMLIAEGVGMWSFPWWPGR